MIMLIILIILISMVRLWKGFNIFIVVNSHPANNRTGLELDYNTCFTIFYWIWTQWLPTNLLTNRPGSRDAIASKNFICIKFLDFGFLQNCKHMCSVQYCDKDHLWNVFQSSQILPLQFLINHCQFYFIAVCLNICTNCAWSIKLPSLIKRILKLRF